MKPPLAALITGTLLAAPLSAGPSMVATANPFAAYPTCAALNDAYRAYPGGISRTQEIAAAHKGRQLVDPELYLANRHLDYNSNGTACGALDRRTERSRSRVVTLDTACEVTGVDGNWGRLPIVAYRLSSDGRVYRGRITERQRQRLNRAHGNMVWWLHRGRTTVTYDLSCRGVTSRGGVAVSWTMDRRQRESVQFWDYPEGDPFADVTFAAHREGDTWRLGRYRHPR